LIFAAAAMLVLASPPRLGFVANFISQPVLIGFRPGIGLVIVLDQVPKILGIHGLTQLLPGLGCGRMGSHVDVNHSTSSTFPSQNA
jgi:MFS superfamily sulfate permease-like transporter